MVLEQEKEHGSLILSVGRERLRHWTSMIGEQGRGVTRTGIFPQIFERGTHVVVEVLVR